MVSRLPASMLSVKMEPAVDSKILAQDIPKVHHQLTEISDRIKGIKEHVSKIKVHTYTLRGVNSTGAGISLLELKFQLLLSYLVNCVQVVMMKLNGDPIKSTRPLHRIVEIRTVLEKIRPLDQKLKYQIDKLVRTAAAGIASASSDPLQFKPNPSNLVSKVEDDSSSDNEEQSHSNPKLYVPPKVVSSYYNEKPDKRERKRKQSALIDEMKEEVLDMPSEVKTTIVVGGQRRQKELAEQKELERFEESNMMRIFRKRKSHDAGRSNRQELDDLAEFSGQRFTKNAGDYPSQKKKRQSFTKKKQSFRKRK